MAVIKMNLPIDAKPEDQKICLVNVDSVQDLASTIKRWFTQNYIYTEKVLCEHHQTCAALFGMRKDLHVEAIFPNDVNLKMQALAALQQYYPEVNPTANLEAEYKRVLASFDSITF